MLAPAETLGSTAPVVESHPEKSEFAQRTPETGAIALATKSRRPRSVRAINERPAIAAVPIGHRDGPPALALEPAIPVVATPETPEVSELAGGLGFEPRLTESESGRQH